MASMKIAVSHLVLCALLGVTGIEGKPPSQVVGGSLAADSEFPWQISLNKYNQHICGGSILDSTHILTAAHCVNDDKLNPWSMSVTTGTNDIGLGKGQTHRIKSIKVHPRYIPSEAVSWQNDIAVLTLSAPIKFDSRTRAIQLPTRDTPGNARAVASGWGSTSYPNGRTPANLRKVSMTTIANGRCSLPGAGSIQATHLCASSTRGSGVCTGDSGGPLVVEGTLAGVASFVIPCGLGYPDVFTRVFSYVAWIRQVLQTS